MFLEDSTIEKVPKDTSVEVGKAGNLPCTVKSSVDYVTVIWKQTVISLFAGLLTHIGTEHFRPYLFMEDSGS